MLLCANFGCGSGGVIPGVIPGGTSNADPLARSASEPGLSVDELLRGIDAVIRLDGKIRAAQRKLGRQNQYPAVPRSAVAVLPLDERLRAHFVDGGTSVH